MDNINESPPQPELVVDIPPKAETPNQFYEKCVSLPSLILTRIHAGYFRIGLSFCGQVLLWKILGEENNNSHIIQPSLSSSAYILLWSGSLFTMITLSLLYILRCYFHFNMVKAEFQHHVGVNYLFAPWISWLILLQSSPFLSPGNLTYLILWCMYMIPVAMLDVKIYGQWFTGKKFLSLLANPTSQLSVIANLVVARAAAQMGWKESALFFFAMGITHYVVLFVTLYQRLSGSDRFPAMLRPVFFLFIAAPSTASLAWDSVSRDFGTPSKMLFFLSIFLFASLICRPSLFKKSMRRFNIAWWAYSFPLSVLATASTEYTREVEGGVANWLMLVLLALSVLVFLALIVFTAFKARALLMDDDPMLSCMAEPINFIAVTIRLET